MAFITLEVVVSFDVDTVPNLEVRAFATVGSALFYIILVSCFTFLMYCVLYAYSILIASFIFIPNYSAANTV